MGYPSSRGETPGYPEDSGLRTKGSSFKGKNLYLVHGSADDNVHIQNTDILSQALVKENIQFKLQVNNYCSLKVLNLTKGLLCLFTNRKDLFLRFRIFSTLALLTKIFSFHYPSTPRGGKGLKKAKVNLYN